MPSNVLNTPQVMATRPIVGSAGSDNPRWLLRFLSFLNQSARFGHSFERILHINNIRAQLTDKRRQTRDVIHLTVT